VDSRIILVRHGETEANRLGCFAASDDVPLTPLGERQAQELALDIGRQFRPSKIYSSEYHRARQTAAVIAEQFGAEVTVLPGIHERNFGVLRGKPYGHMGLMMEADGEYDATKRWLWTPPDGESLDQVRARTLAALSRIRAEGDVVVVTHGAVMETITAHLEGWENACVPPNCAITVLSASQIRAEFTRC
jgi:2,3-bisphosphoglycerate-dependent phosphoglycerate mutase